MKCIVMTEKGYNETYAVMLPQSFGIRAYMDAGCLVVELLDALTAEVIYQTTFDVDAELLVEMAKPENLWMKREFCEDAVNELIEQLHEYWEQDECDRPEHFDLEEAMNSAGMLAEDYTVERLEYGHKAKR